MTVPTDDAVMTCQILLFDVELLSWASPVSAAVVRVGFMGRRI